jgi:hypothetical protein
MYKNLFQSKKQITVITFDAIFGKTTEPREFLLQHDTDADVLEMARHWLKQRPFKTGKPEVKYTTPLNIIEEIEVDYLTSTCDSGINVKELIDMLKPVVSDTTTKLQETVLDKLKPFLDTVSENTITKYLKASLDLDNECCPEVERASTEEPVRHTYILTTPLGNRSIEATCPLSKEFGEKFMEIIKAVKCPDNLLTMSIINGDIRIIATTDEAFSKEIDVFYITDTTDTTIFDELHKCSTGSNVPQFSYTFVITYTNNPLPTTHIFYTETCVENAKKQLFKKHDLDLEQVETIKLVTSTDPRINPYPR